MNELIKVAAWWIDQGFDVAPAQPNTKRFLDGFGPHLQHFTIEKDASEFFEPRSCLNIVAITRENNFILDFDSPELYTLWAGNTPQSKIGTYSESTPRGGHHLFYRGEPPKGLKLKIGVELKRAVVVAPSKVDERIYTRGAGEIVTGDVEAIFQELSEPGTPTAHLLNTMSYSKPNPPFHLSKTIIKIKEQFSVIVILQEFYPERIKDLAGRGRYVSMRCPFHKGGNEINPSFWIDVQTNMWGCHTCGISGDAINLFAKIKGLSNSQAIKELASRLA
jgi:hypothetical protein